MQQDIIFDIIVNNYFLNICFRPKNAIFLH